MDNIKTGSNYFVIRNSGEVLQLTGKQLKNHLENGGFGGGEEIYEGNKIGVVQSKTVFEIK